MAVDNLVEKLVKADPKLNLIRVGHPARILPQVSKLDILAYSSSGAIFIANADTSKQAFYGSAIPCQVKERRLQLQWSRDFHQSSSQSLLIWT